MARQIDHLTANPANSSLETGASLGETDRRLELKRVLSGPVLRTKSRKPRKGPTSRSALPRLVERQYAGAFTPPLACPYYKRDPIRFSDCRRYNLQRVKDIKQHLHRRHSTSNPTPSQPAMAVCGESRNGGTQTCHPHCLPTSIPQHEDSPTFPHRSRHKTVQEQWYRLWESLFPNVTRPPSVFLGSFLEESIPQLRRLWVDKREDIMAQNWPLSSIPSRFADAIMESFLGILERGDFGGKEEIIQQETPLASSCDAISWATPVGYCGSNDGGDDTTCPSFLPVGISGFGLSLVGSDQSLEPLQSDAPLFWGFGGEASFGIQRP